MSLRAILASDRLCRSSLVLRLSADALAAALQLSPGDLDAEALSFDIPVDVRRRGTELRLVSGATALAPDQKMHSALAKAQRWTAELRRGVSLADLADREQRSEMLLRTRCALAFLSPAIQAAILDGRQPVELTLERLVRTPIPHDWDAQARLFGFA